MNSHQCFLVGQAWDRQMPTYQGTAWAVGPASVVSPWRERHFQGLAGFHPLWAQLPQRGSQQARQGLHATSWAALGQLSKGGPLSLLRSPRRAAGLSTTQIWASPGARSILPDSPGTSPKQGSCDLSPTLGGVVSLLWSSGTTDILIITFTPLECTRLP